MENPYGFTTGLGQPFGLTTYPRASRAVDFAGPDGQPFQVAHRSLDNALALPTKPTAVLLIFSLHFQNLYNSSVPERDSKQSNPQQEDRKNIRAFIFYFLPPFLVLDY